MQTIGMGGDVSKITSKWFQVGRRINKIIKNYQNLMRDS